VYDSSAGAGYRWVLVYAVGRVHAKAVYPSTAAAVSVPVAKLGDRLPVPRGLIGRLEAKVRERKRLGLSYSRTAVKAALAALRQR